MNAFYNIRVPNGNPIAYVNRASTPLFDLIKITENAVSNDELITAEQISDALFPLAENAIFISHFSAEIDAVLQAKQIIEERTNCRCFVDSEVWGSVYGALAILKDKYAQQWTVINKDTNLEEVVYDGNDCLYFDKHLFLILAHSLQQAIMRSSAFVFLSASPNETIINIDDNLHVESPWVALEFLASLRINSLPMRKTAALNESQLPRIAYQIYVKHLCIADVDSFITDFNKVYGR